MNVRVKICGITRRSDAEFALECGASAVGFVLAETSSRYVSLAALVELTRNLPGIKVGVFVNAGIDFIRRAVVAGALDVVQLHGSESANFARAIDFAEVWKATYEPDFPAHILVCDAPAGGSGRPGDQAAAARIARMRRIMLAGGLTPANIGAAIERVRPWGVDISSGVESAPGIKDHHKIVQLFTQIKDLAL